MTDDAKSPTPSKTTEKQVPIKPVKRFDPSSVVPFNRMAAKFWFLLFLCMTAVAVCTPFVMLEQMKQKERLVLLDEAGTWHVAPILSFEEADTMHNYVATIATGALLHRGPLGPDNPGLLKQLYLETAYKKANAFLKAEAGHFDEKSVHQKVEIARIQLLETSKKEVIAVTEGQLIRIGDFEGESFTDNKIFKMKFRLIRNPRLGLNGRLPLAVMEWKIKISDVKETESDDVMKTEDAKDETKEGTNK
jgi:hypothetical protein